MTALRPFHPLADIFPLIEGEEFDQLVASIKASAGPRELIVIHEGMILDGRNRARACKTLGIEPLYTPFKGDDPLVFVLDKNLHRRHLDDRQRASVAAKIANFLMATIEANRQLAV
jgi:ParB-like chromosome segregation protein Spo0J